MGIQSKAIATGLSGNEILLMADKHLTPGRTVVGNSVMSRGFAGSLGSMGRSFFGGEVTPVTEAIQQGRWNAFMRMYEDAKERGAMGVVGVESSLTTSKGHTEFVFTGSAVHTSDGFIPNNPFSSAGDAQELWCHIDAGYRPRQHVFGNIAYSVGVPGLTTGNIKKLGRGEIPEFSNIFNRTREVALQRIVADARKYDANAVVGIRTVVEDYQGTHEMLMTGTAAKNAALAQESALTPVTSDLTGEEMWAMTSLGYAPVGLVMSTSVYSLGAFGALKAWVQGFQKGEIDPLTKLFHEARDVAVDRLETQSKAMGGELVVGTKTYYCELGGGGLVEFMTIGTAMTKREGVKVDTPRMLTQAIAPDKDTWVGGVGGFTLNRGPG